MKTALTWIAVIAAVMLGVHWFAGVYDSGPTNLAVDGETVLGRGWAADVSVARNDVRAWAPPNGIPRVGAIG